MTDDDGLIGCLSEKGNRDGLDECFLCFLKTFKVRVSDVFISFLTRLL